MQSEKTRAKLIGALGTVILVGAIMLTMLNAGEMASAFGSLPTPTATPPSVGEKVLGNITEALPGFTIYLPLILKDYVPGAPTPTATPTGTPTPTPTATLSPLCDEYIQNGGFETGSASPWVAYSKGGYDVVSTENPHSGRYGAWLGGYDNAHDSLYQVVTIPANASSATLSYWWYMTTGEAEGPHDYLTVRIEDADGNPLEVLETVSDRSQAGVWVRSSFDVSAYAGQTIRVDFVADTNESNDTDFFVDDISLLVCVMAPTPTATPTVPPCFYDDFSDPASGWPIIDDSYAICEYLEGEYRIKVKKEWVVYLVSPGIRFSDFTLEVDGGHATQRYGSWGLAFGISDDWKQFYTFEVYADKYFAIWKYDRRYGWSDRLVWRSSPYIHRAQERNRLKVVRDGIEMTVYANEHRLVSITESTFTGLRRVGLVVSSYDVDKVDCRFDNFQACPLGGATAARVPSGVGEAAGGAGFWIGPRERSQGMPGK